MSGYELAQLNIAQLLAPIDSPRLQDFVANLDRINELAEASRGFLWRLKGEGNDATSLEHPFGDELIVNLSVWDSIESLHAYVYRSAHAPIMARRKEWFGRMLEASAVLWWVPVGHRPDVVEAHDRLSRLRADGPTAAAFGFKQSFVPS